MVHVEENIEGLDDLSLSHVSEVLVLRDLTELTDEELEVLYLYLILTQQVYLISLLLTIIKPFHLVLHDQDVP